MVSFVDRVTLHLRAGDGGDGCVSVRREKFKPLAGPDGANGGNGGSIVLEADPQVTTLLDYHRRPHRRAENGGFGMGDMRAGASGKDVILPVPVGTVASTPDGELIADLTSPGMRVVVAQGGQGGLGNAALASPRRKAPGFALLGLPGFEGDVVLELKTMADVALVGYPSAGKSSLIAAMSAARPKIADYPFTTLQPNLGVVEYGDVRFTIADVPGLIEGASEGRGLGLEFLRHVERCSALLHVVDAATPETDRDPLTDLEIIRRELAAYEVPEGQTPLLERPQLVALNKVDVPDGREMADLMQAEIEALGFRVFRISAVTREGLRELGFALAEIVAEARAQQAKQAASVEHERIVLRPKAVNEREFVIEVEEDEDGPVYRIIGEKPERWVAQTMFDNEEAIGFLADRLSKIGIDEELFKVGAVAGATVVIGRGEAMVFDWEPTLTSAAELIASPRGTDPRFADRSRRTNVERREEYHQRMDAKSAARAELEQERIAGLWRDGASGADTDEEIEDE